MSAILNHKRATKKISHGCRRLLVLLNFFRHFYPDIESSAMFRHFDKMIVKKKAEKKSPLQGYVKTTSRMDIQLLVESRI